MKRAKQQGLASSGREEIVESFRARRNWGKNKKRAYRQGQKEKNKKSQLHRQDNEADEGSKKAD